MGEVQSTATRSQVQSTRNQPTAKLLEYRRRPRNRLEKWWCKIHNVDTIIYRVVLVEPDGKVTELA